MVADGLLSAGIGIDDYAAVHFIDEKFHEVVSTKPDARAYRVVPRPGGGSLVSKLSVRQIEGAI
jgi:hypothetical protein